MTGGGELKSAIARPGQPTKKKKPPAQRREAMKYVLRQQKSASFPTRLRLGFGVVVSWISPCFFDRKPCRHSPDRTERKLRKLPRNLSQFSALRDGVAIANETENQIVVYQPDSVMRIEVRFDGETVWLPQSQIAELFSCSLENVRLHLKNIYASGELEKTATSKESLEVRKEGLRNVTRKFSYYNLDAIISIGYRVNSIVGVRFRQWATQVIKERMFAGAMQAAQFAAIDRRLLSHEKDIAKLKDPRKIPSEK